MLPLNRPAARSAAVSRSPRPGLKALAGPALSRPWR